MCGKLIRAPERFISVDVRREGCGGFNHLRNLDLVVKKF